MITENGIEQVTKSRRPRAGWLVYLAVLIVMGVGIALAAARSMATTPAPVASGPQPYTSSNPESGAATSNSPMSAADALYIVAMGAPLDELSPILALDPKTGAVRSQIWARYKPAVILSADGRILYVVDTFWTRVLRGDVVHALTALDTQTGSVLWEVDLPGPRNPYLGDATTGVWTSADGGKVYVLMGTSGDRPDARIVVIETSTQQVVKEINIALPYDPRWHWPKFWKPTWSDRLVVVSWNQVFTVDLNSGNQSEAVTLAGFEAEDRARIPQNLNQFIEVLGGDIASQVRRLYLVTSAQDILTIELEDSLVVRRVFTLPSGWEVGIGTPMRVSDDGRSVYLGVRRIASPIKSARVAEEVWVYDANTWQRIGTVRPSDQGGDSAWDLDQGFFSMELSRDGQWLYTANYQTSGLSIIDTRTMQEIRAIPNLRLPPHSLSGQPAWVISR